jgi:hypothetical protein
MSRQHISLLAILACSSVIILVYAIRERSEVNAVAESRNRLGADLSAARAEIQRLSSRIDDLAMKAASTPEPLPPVATPTRSFPVERRRPAAPISSRAKNTSDPRWRRVESQLANHQSQLTDQRKRITQTQEDLRRTGDQLDGRINSTKDELNGSITATHDDVVLLQKRGERSIYEFDLAKSKQFQRVGPLSLSLRKADTKHRSYDLTVMVDDKPVEKQHVNLSEPVWVSLADLSQPIELVVNQIDKNRVRGYVSAPRYKNAELAGPPAPGSAQPPALKSR